MTQVSLDQNTTRFIMEQASRARSQNNGQLEGSTLPGRKMAHGSLSVRNTQAGTNSILSTQHNRINNDALQTSIFVDNNQGTTMGPAGVNASSGANTQNKQDSLVLNSNPDYATAGMVAMETNIH